MGYKAEQFIFDRFVSHDGTELAYRTSGSGKRVVMLHGVTVTTTTNFATHYEDDRNGGLVATAGPTVESALHEAGCELALMDLRGHGHSDKPHDAARYTMDAFVDDVRSLVAHLGWSSAALVGYSFGAMMAERLLSDPWVSRVALCGQSSSQVEGVTDDYGEFLTMCGKCFLDDSWDEHPEASVLRTWAELSPGCDFVALGLVLCNAVRAISPDVLKAAPVPVLVLNGGGDYGASDEEDLTPFIPGAERVVAGTCHHGTAPSDPLFQQALARFVTAETSPPRESLDRTGSALPSGWPTSQNVPPAAIHKHPQ